MNSVASRSVTPRSSALLAKACLGCCLLFSVAVTLITAPAARAQLSGVTDSAARDAGSIQGSLRIKDSHKPAANVKVTLREIGQSVTTNEKGRYSFSNVPPGTYTLLATGEGYGRTRITDVTVRPGIDLSLSSQVIATRLPNQEPLELEDYIVSAKKNDGVVELDPYLVSGRRARAFSDSNVDLPRTVNDVQPYFVYDRATIERTGSADIAEFLQNWVPMNTSAGLAKQQNIAPIPGANAGDRTTVTFRGLASSDTLILINGRRLPSINLGNSISQPSLNTIPLAAIERIEVLPVSSSAIYGGQAVAGVLNVVLKDRYVGAEIRLGYSNVFESDASRRSFDASAGFALKDTHFMVSVHANDGTNLLLQDRRNIVERGLLAVRANNPALLTNLNIPPAGETANISSPGAPLVLKTGQSLGSNITFIPRGYAGVASDGGAALLTNAGRLNLGMRTTNQLGALQSGLGYEPSVASLSASVRHKLTPAVELFVDAFHSRNKTEILNNPFASLVVVPASSPANPFQQAVRVAWTINAGKPYRSEKDQTQITAGFIARLPREWSLQGDYTRTESRWKNTAALIDNAALSAALNNGSLDVFRDTVAFPLPLNQFLSTQNDYDLPSSSDDFSLRGTGPVEVFRGATVSASLQHFVERSEVGFETVQSPTSTTRTMFPEKEQSTTSAYAEIWLPLVNAERRYLALRQLDLQLAGRFDRYSVTTATSNISSVNGAPFPQVNYSHSKFSAANPTLGARWRPFEGLMFRGSYSTGFRPPSYTQLLTSPPSATLTNITDPRRNNTVYGVTTITGGNPTLEPEESSSLSYGMVFEPKYLSGLRIAVDYSRTRKSNAIVGVGVQQVVDNESLLPDRVLRAPLAPGDTSQAGQVTSVDVRLINSTDLQTESYDILASYKFGKGRVGVFHIVANATIQQHLKQQLALGGPLNEYVNTPLLTGLGSGEVLKFRGTGVVTWEKGPWTVGWSTIYIPSYWVGTANELAQGSKRVRSHITHHLYGAFRFGDSASLNRGWRSLLVKSEIQVGVQNIFNESPPFSAANAPYYYSQLGDPRLRQYSLAFKKYF